MRIIKERLQFYSLEDMQKAVGIVARVIAQKNTRTSVGWSMAPNILTNVMELTYPALDSDELDDAFIELEFDILGDYYPEYLD